MPLLPSWSRRPPSWRVALPALLAMLAPPLSAQDAANPFTGQPLSLERMHWALEQARLDEQLQASLLNRRKFELERERLDETGAGGSKAAASPTGAALPGLPATPGVPLTDLAMASGSSAVEVSRPAMPAAPDASRTGPRHRGQRHARPPAPQGPTALQVVGVRIQGSGWCLLVTDADALRPLCPGEWRLGHHVEMVSATSYRLDGHDHVLEIPVAQLRQRDTAVRFAADAPRPGGGDEDGGTGLAPAIAAVEPVQAALSDTAEVSGSGPVPRLPAPVRSARP